MIKGDFIIVLIEPDIFYVSNTAIIYPELSGSGYFILRMRVFTKGDKYLCKQSYLMVIPKRLIGGKCQVGSDCVGCTMWSRSILILHADVTFLVFSWYGIFIFVAWAILSGVCVIKLFHVFGSGAEVSPKETILSCYQNKS